MRFRELSLRAIKLGLLPYGVVTRESRNGVIILIYHRVGGGSSKELDLPTDLFDWQMRYLREHFTIMRIDDVQKLTQPGANANRNAVVVTFDDGYEDVYHYAFPILARHQIPATIYLATEYLENRRIFPWEMSLTGPLRGWPLIWGQVEEMVRSGLVTVGAHTHTHRNLTQITFEDVEQELEISNRIISERLGLACMHFAYPWGQASGATKRLVDRTYKTVAIKGSRRNPYGQIDLHGLMRTPIQRSDGRFFFRCKVGSYLHGEEWVRTIADRKRRTGPYSGVGVPVSR